MQPYPYDFVYWMWSMLEATEWRWTPAQILDTEHQYPGLLDKVFTVNWQHALIKKQMDDDSEG